MTRSTIRQDIVNIPNLLTLFRITLIPIVCVLLIDGEPKPCLIAASLFGVASLTDWFDGYIARKRGLVSLTGKFLDPLADKLLVMAVLVMLVALGRVPAWLVIIILAREFSVQGLRSLAASEGYVIAAGAGGKYKTAFQMVGLGGLLLHYTYAIDYLVAAPVLLNFNRLGTWLLAISVLFGLISAWDYFRDFLRVVERIHEEEPG